MPGRLDARAARALKGTAAAARPGARRGPAWRPAWVPALLTVLVPLVLLVPWPAPAEAAQAAAPSPARDWAADWAGDLSAGEAGGGAAGGEGGRATTLGGVAEARALHLRAGGEDAEQAGQALLRVTLEHEAGAGLRLVGHAQWEHLSASSPATLQRLQAAAPPLDRALRLSTGQSHALGLDWLYLQGGWRHGRYVIGRQPIAPSLGRLWSPADVFGPFLPSDLERLYKPGVDAVQVSVFAGERLTLTTTLSADRDQRGSVRAKWMQRAQLEAPWGRAFALAGQRRAQHIAGAGVQVNGVAGNDLHAELLWHRGPVAQPGVEGRHAGVRALLGASRKLAPNTVGTVEWLHQSRGIADPARYDAFAERAAAIDLPPMGVGRHYAGVSVSAQPHPLLNADVLLLANLSDRSATLVGALVHTPLPNLKLRATLGVPVAGGAGSEYRRAGTALQLGLQWFF